MVPAWSTRTKKNGTPLAPTRCSVDRRWATCSIEAAKPPASASRSWRSACALVEEAAVGQERRAGEVVGEPGHADRPRRLGAEAGEVERGLEQVAVLDQRDLVQDLEGLGRGGGVRAEGEPAGRRLVAAQRGAGLDAEGDAVPRLEPVGEGGPAFAGREPGGEALGGAVDRVDVVVAVVEEVAHLLPGQRAQRAVLAAERLVELGQPLLGLAVGAVQGEEGAGEIRARSRRRAGCRRAAGGGAEDRVGQRLAHVGDDALARAGGELADVDAELLRPATASRGPRPGGGCSPSG